MNINTHQSWILIMAAAFILLFSPGSQAEKSGEQMSSAAQVKQETRELLQALKSYSAEQRDQAIETSKAALDKIDRRIEALETKIDKQWDKMDQAARESARESLRELRRQRNQVAESFGSLKTGTAAAWDNMKQGFSEAYQALEDAWEKSEQEFTDK